MRTAIGTDPQLDTQHNALETVYQNVFLNFALTAMKIPRYFGNFGTVDLDTRRSELVYGWLTMSAEYTYSAGRARVRHAAGNRAEHFALQRRSFML